VFAGAGGKKITGKAEVGFVSSKQTAYLSKVRATTANIPVEGGTHTGPVTSLPQPGIGSTVHCSSSFLYTALYYSSYN